MAQCATISALGKLSGVGNLRSRFGQTITKRALWKQKE